MGGILPAWAVKLKNRIKSDECSFSPEGSWGTCCVIHDYHYRVGRSFKDKCAADRALHKCIERSGHDHIATLYYIGVATGGWISWIRKRMKDPPPDNWKPPEAPDNWDPW